MKYKAFGLIIDSEFELPQVLPAPEDSDADVRICYSELSKSGLVFEPVFVGEQEFRMCPYDIANMRVTDGKLIEIEPLNTSMNNHIIVYIMGSCMGAILHQRGIFPLHGSCVTDGKRSVLLSGHSGAGKSTLAAEFISHGWKLLTDDVAVIKGIEEGDICVQSSYPSQKLWEDSLNNYSHSEEDVHSLYSRGDELKYGVNVAEHFYEGTAPLSLFVRLVINDEEDSKVVSVEGFGKVEQIRINTYRSYMVEDKQKYFQRCVTLGTKIPMAVSIRKQGDSCATLLYEQIVNILDKQENAVHE